MLLDHRESRRRLQAHDHGVLSTRHDTRGVDAVPVVYAVTDDHVGIPIDVVKAKSATRLQRERNLAADPRAGLLVQHWDADDWSKLWWVRAQLRWFTADPHLEGTLADVLADRYVQYRDRPFVRVLVFEVVDLNGWCAEPASGTG